jgi:hypothetical protein
MRCFFVRTPNLAARARSWSRGSYPSQEIAGRLLLRILSIFSIFLRETVVGSGRICIGPAFEDLARADAKSARTFWRRFIDAEYLRRHPEYDGVRLRPTLVVMRSRSRKKEIQNASQLSTGSLFPCCIIISNGKILGIVSEGRTPAPVAVTDALMTCGATTTGFHQMKMVAATARTAAAE